MNRKGPWEGYRRQARERHLGMRQALNATDREEGLILVELVWHRYIRLLGSLTLPSETAVEDFIARQAPQTSSAERTVPEFSIFTFLLVLLLLNLVRQISW
ncbi:unnamed protein product [Porites lobata]|uniref:Uncharacterized protein n=1 Tax=Porites lobata TaxID=104759 RepID=A0ABN8S2E2_9CNID|nr:unnamed protein product [Porites lobata]